MLEMSDKEPFIEIELHQIELRYAHIRINRQAAQRRMLQSIVEYGQLMPVLVTPEAEGRYVLIDGYLRISALHNTGHDTVRAVIQRQAEAEALIGLLTDMRRRTFQAVEEGLLFLELVSRFNLSLEAVGRRIGKDKSYVKRRLDLIRGLSNAILAIVLEGHISTWSAQRVLVPLARANADHAQRLCAYLKHEPMTTRALKRFFDHYQKARPTVRERMIDAPGLFIQATEVDPIAPTHGPETCWEKDLSDMCHVIDQMIGKVPDVFYPGLPDADRTLLLASLAAARLKFKNLENEIERRVESSHP